MGIGFSHGGASWSYSGFNHFRKLLAESIGFDLHEYEGYYTEEEKKLLIFSNIIEEWQQPDFSYKKSWDEYNGPLKDLFNHSDSDGDFTPQQCEILAPQLREIVSTWSDTYEEVKIGNYDKIMGLKLAAGMDECAKTNAKLKFR